MSVQKYAIFSILQIISKQIGAAMNSDKF